ncbi:hypothetical protein PoB_006578100 [Plakobranchus ocellatus]|uniref:Uncharacterized protein n=1 Tax=Plakobranchus ocellatus TaxID=259542 RepID=A0AAV4D5B0_9GAST|nr:hypothetical protein PoB_006578100 [Plakobranchus ocellatus]
MSKLEPESHRRRRDLQHETMISHVDRAAFATGQYIERRSVRQDYSTSRCTGPVTASLSGERIPSVGGYTGASQAP